MLCSRFCHDSGTGTTGKIRQVYSQPEHGLRDFPSMWTHCRRCHKLTIYMALGFLDQVRQFLGPTTLGSPDLFPPVCLPLRQRSPSLSSLYQKIFLTMARLKEIEVPLGLDLGKNRGPKWTGSVQFYSC